MSNTAPQMIADGAARVVALVEQAVADGSMLGNNVNERGVTSIITQMRTALPRVARILVAGAPFDVVDPVIESTITTMIAADREHDDDIAREVRTMEPDESENVDRQCALYLLGVLVGAELARLTSPSSGGVR